MTNADEPPDYDCPRWCRTHRPDCSATSQDAEVTHHSSAHIYWSDDRAGAFVSIQRVDGYGTSIPAGIFITDGEHLVDGIYDVTVDEARTLGEALQLLAETLEQDGAQLPVSVMNRR